MQERARYSPEDFISPEIRQKIMFQTTKEMIIFLERISDEIFFESNNLNSFLHQIVNTLGKTLNQENLTLDKNRDAELAAEIYYVLLKYMKIRTEQRQFLQENFNAEDMPPLLEALNKVWGYLLHLPDVDGKEVILEEARNAIGYLGEMGIPLPFFKASFHSLNDDNGGVETGIKLEDLGFLGNLERRLAALQEQVDKLVPKVAGKKKWGSKEIVVSREKVNLNNYVFFTGNEFDDTEEFEELLKIFTVPDSIISKSKNTPSLFDFYHEDREKALLKLMIILKKYFSKHENVYDMIRPLNNNFSADLIKQDILAELLIFLREIFTNEKRQNHIFLNFLKNDKLNNKQRLIALIFFILSHKVKDSKEYKNYRKKVLENFDINKYEINEETFALLESLNPNTRLEGLKSLILQYLYGANNQNSQAKLSMVLLNDEISWQGLRASLFGTGKEKAEEILKSFMEESVIVDLRDF